MAMDESGASDDVGCGLGSPLHGEISAWLGVVYRHSSYTVLYNENRDTNKPRRDG